MTLVRPFKPSDAVAFRDLNLAWIEQFFLVEDEDLTQLSDPQGQIIEKSGRILIAEVEGEVVGTVALVPGHQEGIVELIKMSARADLRGQGIGKALMTAAIEEAEAMGAERIWLETNTKLEAALRLYRRAGFRDLTEEERHATPYSRCNCQMVLEF